MTGWVLNWTARGVLAAILLMDACAGLGWALGSPTRSSTPAYRPVRALLDFLPADPARWWGSLLFLLSAAALAALFARADVTRPLLVAIVAYWCGWVLNFSYAAVEVPRSALFPVWIMLITIIGHVRAVGSPELLDDPS